MKRYYLFLIPLILLSCSVTNSQLSVKNHFDEKDNSVKEKIFQERWRNKENDLFRWDYINETGQREAKLVSPVYKAYQINYAVFNQQLEKLTNKDFPENQIFFIEYIFVNDLCAEGSSNHWSNSKIKGRKKFTDKAKEDIEKTPDRIVVHFFEEGIILGNNKLSEMEYFFMDTGNFLRNNLFTQSALCGSLAIITPDGQALVRNGEYSMSSMAEHLNTENWELFFPSPE